MAYYGSSKYQYETSPRKIKPEYEQIKKKYPKKSSAKRNNSKKNTQNRSKVNTNTNTISHKQIILYIVVGFAIAFTISYRYSMIDKTYSNLQALKGSLAATQKEIAQLQANMESTLNLSDIEKQAEEKLGMKKLGTEQIVYVTLPKSDHVETSSEEIEEEEETDNWFMKIINKIMGTLK